MLIRQATKADLPQLAQIYLQVRQQTFTWLAAPQLADLQKETKGEQLVVAENRGVICGFAAFQPAASFVHLLIVTPAAQRQGVGRALLQTLQQRRHKLLRLKCVKSNQVALDFYAHLGFQIIKDNASAQPANYTLQATRFALGESENSK
ncbi:GNAT family N-acetyltransferase [Loigolactobacillus zhaoyuanensis]|uniref:N-acetyltransferase family protein n=1 Tax=Loigolactobacillus zhaoyuanensis TaxID=2486017 RepID=A0ABW8UB73_9LACO|nr:GNAT family N-acetyltransferase [Loigolactobacillus zhaoyuanensis]